MTEARQRLGKKGEDAACAYLERKGYVICRRNYRCRYGEIDIIAAKGGELSFVEVKNTPQPEFWAAPSGGYIRQAAENQECGAFLFAAGKQASANAQF